MFLMFLDPPMRPVTQVSRRETRLATGSEKDWVTGSEMGWIPGQESKTLHRPRPCRPHHRESH